MVENPKRDIILETKAIKGELAPTERQVQESLRRLSEIAGLPVYARTVEDIEFIAGDKEVGEEGITEEELEDICREKALKDAEGVEIKQQIEISPN